MRPRNNEIERSHSLLGIQPEDQTMTRWQKITAVAASLLIACGFLFASPSFAQSPSEEDMLNALRSKAPAVPKTRGLTLGSSQDDGQRAFIDSIRGKTRQLTLGERKKVAEIAKTKPNIDLEIYFEYDSSAIAPNAEPDLMKLGRVLTSADLKGNVFLIAGHTDAKGSDAYNQGLSERRAASVKRFLQRNFDIPDNALVTAGYGEEQLKNTADPYAAENRRVQVVNLENKETAQR
jgi:outer membrane protein OmpA-like peptidoglycan-associated protein